MIYRIFIVGLLSSIISIMPLSAAAAEMKKVEGLSISPLRQEVTVTPGKTASGTFVVGNTTEKPMLVKLSVQQFSVADYTYDYKFKTPPDNDWVRLSETALQLSGRQSKKIPFTITVPEKTTPGGYYFSLIASTDIVAGGFPSTVQAATLLYMTVDGKLVRTSVLQNAKLPFFIMGSEIPYQFDVKNTGNVHFSAYFYGQTETLLLGKQPEAGTSHLVMPGAIRTVNGSIPSPFWPGIYKVTYGYKVDFASIITTKSSYILYIPPWSSFALIAVLFIGGIVWQRRRPDRQAEDN